MALIIPGVKCARRRRIHQSGGSSDSPSQTALGFTRKSYFCLYTSNNGTHQSFVSSQQRSMFIRASEDEKLGGVAGEAKERLDERLRSHAKSEPKRQNSKESLKCLDGKCLIQTELHAEMLGPKKSGQKWFSWANLSSKASDQEECAICPERFKASFPMSASVSFKGPACCHG
ncbi:uncharacterized protein LOC111300202 [Durio zibethinus]|uniref:Uncharacterized protein LOC111300202 n=1 Tax=Durio zibethinus TaxID=66656 RepID=A0A6P5ZFH3_DURZI|nr:uncharacterized protein LOC111300202 [Durio zibethinus]